MIIDNEFDDVFEGYYTPEPNTGCWLWTRGVDRQGYGALRHDDHIHKAHRLAWTLTFGRVADSKLFVCHKCDVRSCINPHHLFLGTNTDNVNDMVRKGRYWSKKRRDGLARGERHGSVTHPERLRRGEGHANSKLSETVVKEIRSLSGKVSSVELAKRFNVSKATITSVWSKRTWAHVD
jgi:hypothetical protein